MNSMGEFPVFTPMTLEAAREAAPFTYGLSDGVCEFVFGNLFLCRSKYSYTISALPCGGFVLGGIERAGGASGIQGKFFSIIDNPDAPDGGARFCGEEAEKTLDCLWRRFDFWKSMTAPQYARFGPALAERGFRVEQNRSNFDYLYLRSELAALSGKKFHKKKNLVNAFNAAYHGEARALTAENRADALAVLNTWERLHAGEAPTDYDECAAALETMEALALSGVIAYADGKPAAFSLGEFMAAGTMYCVHFEKGIDTFKGIYQYINQQEALALPESVKYINREQDVGDEGLRQAKMTYRPAAFVEKYAALKG